MFKFKNKNQKKFFIIGSTISIVCISSILLLINNKNNKIENLQDNKKTDINYKIDSEPKNKYVEQKRQIDKKDKTIKKVEGSKITLQNNKSIDLSTIKPISRNETISPNDIILIREIKGEKYYFIYNKPYTEEVNFQDKKGKVLTCMINTLNSNCIINDVNQSFKIDKNVYVTDGSSDTIEPYFNFYSRMKKGDIVKLFILDDKVVNILRI